MGKERKIARLSDACGGSAVGGGNTRSSLARFLSRFRADDHGGTAIEYSIIAVLISIAGIGALMIIGPRVMQMFTDAGGPF